MSDGCSLAVVACSINGQDMGWYGLQKSETKHAMSLFLAAVFAGMALSSASYAEVVETTSGLKPESRIVAFIEETENIQALAEIGRIWDSRLDLLQDCKSEKKVKLDSFSIIKRVTLPAGQNFPTEGMWSYRFNYERCGEKKTYNAIMEVRPEGKLRITPHVPGNSKASLLLMKDASQATYIGAINKMREKHDLSKCDEGIQLVDALVVPPTDMPLGSWREQWMFMGCGRRTVSISIDFIPSKVGTSYVVGK